MRLRVTKTVVMYVDVPDDEEHRALIEREDAQGRPIPTDGIALAEAAARFENIAGCEPCAYSNGWVSIERDEDPLPWCCAALDGMGPQRRIWRARHILSTAYGLLQRTRHFEGDVYEVDRVIADLRKIDERLRVMALAAEGLGPDHKPLEDLTNA